MDRYHRWAPPCLDVRPPPRSPPVQDRDRFRCCRVSLSWLVRSRQCTSEHLLLRWTGRGRPDSAADRITCVVLLDRDGCTVPNHLHNGRDRDHSQDGESKAGPRNRTPVPSNWTDRHCRNLRSSVPTEQERQPPAPPNPLGPSQAALGFRPAMPPRKLTPRGPPGRTQVSRRQHPTLPATANSRETQRSERCRSRPIDLLQGNPAPNPRKWSATVAREAAHRFVAGRSGHRPRRAQTPVPD